MKKKIVVLRDITEKNFEPYNRNYMLGIVADMCLRTPFMHNASFTSLCGRGYREGTYTWERHDKIMTYVCFEVDDLTDDMWDFLQESIGSWAVTLELQHVDSEDITIMFP